MTRLRTSTLALLWAIGMILVPVFPVFAQFKTGGIELHGKATFFVKSSGTWCGGAATDTAVLCYDTTTDALQLSNNNGSFLNLLLSAGSISIASGKTFTVSNSLTLAGTDGKTLTVSNSLALAGTDATVMTFPSTSATIARLDAAQTFSGSPQTVGIGGTGTNTSIISIDSGSGSGGHSYVQFLRNGSGRGFVGVSGSASGIITGDAANDLAIRNNGPIDFSTSAGASIQAALSATGTLTLTQGALTAGTMTVTQSAAVRTFTTRFDWTNAMVTALGAVTAGDVAVGTLPAKHVVKNAYVVITSAAGTVTTLTVAVGRTGAGYIDYIVASDAKAAANTVYGDAAGERGTNLTGYDLPSFTGTTLINAHFISTGGNLNTVTTSTGAIFLETELLP